MDKDFEKKVRRKRLRAIAVVLIVVALAVYLILDMNVEKADYTDSLKEQITTARERLSEQQNNVGNERGQYAKYTLLAFENQINIADQIAKSEDSEYNDKKDAYEALKDQTEAFKKAANDDVVEASEVKALAKSKKSRDYNVEIKDNKEMTLTLDGAEMNKPVTVNLMAREEGPYYEEINKILSELSLQGQVISFYQEGPFGGRVKAAIPTYSDKKTTGWTYRVDLKKGKLKFVSKAEIDLKGQTAMFVVEEGGDYVVLTKKIHKDAEKSVDIEDAEKDAKGQKNGDTAKGGDDSGNSGGGSSPVTTPEDKDITVSIEIRCDTLANDLSKLEDPALEAYVPSDGTILPVTEVTVKKGSTVYDVLNRVCRNKGIQVEASYTPTYGAYYVEAINYLYEFDGGKLSGWMYKVNGSFPNYGSSEYAVKEGDRIIWVYTCDLGKDVGNGSIS